MMVRAKQAEAFYNHLTLCDIASGVLRIGWLREEEKKLGRVRFLKVYYSQ